jgi:hypothetical protein
MHHYVLVQDGGDIGRFLKDLHDHCWSHGFGWHMIGRAGQLLDRSIVDRMVGFGERLCFEGAPFIVPPLAQDAAKRVPEACEGSAIDSARAVPRLSEYERHRVNEAKEESRKALGKSAAQVREKHDKDLAEKISAKSRVSLATALRLVQARHRGVLYPDVELEFDHLGTVTVGDVLTDPDRFIGETLADPLEGLSYGRGKAMVLKDDDCNLLIHSFAHGRGIYLLRYDLKSATAAFAQGDGTIDHAMAILAQAEIEADEVDAFIRVASNQTGVGLRPLSARVKKERAERERKARDASLKASVQAKAEGRIIRQRPDPMNELGPTVSFIDQVLADDTTDQPPMRNANGYLVRVEEREPWALHLLTSDSANATGVEEAETVKPPAEPVLVELTPITVELLIEKYIAWFDDEILGFAALPTPFIKALMEFPDSVIPVVRAINTSPLVTLSGRVIHGSGLDRVTGLFHRIDPVLRACLPERNPTDEEIKQALDFLLDEWFIDVASDDVGKCIALMLALTILERALLAERPAFFVTAGQAGGGKTTLISMIIAAVFGRRPAAASWSDEKEERKKALFAYLRQSVAVLVWDNIARGSSISCPHIEAALTAAEISDRVLSVSDTETVPAQTVQIFTGNMIGPRGEMASRSFTMMLNVDRPDPENREFKHADPFAWTQTNRAKILQALYTILIGGLRRPQAQTAKTRFKVWWRLIGWPMEYAAALRGVKLDCTELMHSNTSQEEEASAASLVLTILRRRWDTNEFTTRDVMRVLEQANNSLLTGAGEAEELLDALGELAGGKKLERLTAHSLGKLFQKRLTGRPAWIEDNKKIVTAVLRKLPEHQANRYKVEIGAQVHTEQQPPQQDASQGSSTTFQGKDTSRGASRSSEDDALF